MVRFGLRLTLRGGREGLVRLIVTAVAVAIGVAILLSVLADFNAFRTTNGRPCWECTAGAPVTTAAQARPARAELWNYGDDIYAGRTIERLSVAALGPGAPVPPGVAKLPGPGQYYASPALAALLRRVPRDRAGRPFPRPPGRDDRRAGPVRPGRAGHLRRRHARPAGRAAADDPGHRDRRVLGEADLVAVLPGCLRRGRAGLPVPDPHPDRHGDAAGRRPARGALRGPAAGRRHDPPDQRRRGDGRVPDRPAGRGGRHRGVRAAARRGGRHRRHQRPVLPRPGPAQRPGLRRPCWSPSRPRPRSPRWWPCAGCGSRRSASPAGSPRPRPACGGSCRWSRGSSWSPPAWP